MPYDMSYRRCDRKLSKMSVPRTDTESGYELLFIIYSRHLSTECSDFRTISLLGHAAKVLIRVLTKRIEAKAKKNAINHIGKDQFGFRKGKGTRDAIATLRVLGERRFQRGKDLCI